MGHLGVGKSTNLAKICYWLLQNENKVLIAACDTFRAGAVEQLRTHVRKLTAAQAQTGKSADVKLYEKGYGKDPAGIAEEAIGFGACRVLSSPTFFSIFSSFAPLLWRSDFGTLTQPRCARGTAAAQAGYDVVLIDTAGRMQDNEPLMRALAKVRFNPRLIKSSLSPSPFSFLSLSLSLSLVRCATLSLVHSPCRAL